MRRIFLLILIGVMLVLWGFRIWKMLITDRIPLYHIVVLPHHNLTGKRIDQYYQELHDQYSHFDRIVIISPDHFWQLHQSIETSSAELPEICYLNACVKNSPLIPYLPRNEVWESGIFSLSGRTSEHGIGEHITRISHFFPNTLVTPIILRRKLSPWVEEKRLADIISHLPDEKILVITSVDFSHHVREEIAKFHDLKSIEVLNAGSWKDFSDIEVDCRNCLAVAKYIATSRWKHFFHLSDRTSVDMISGSGSDIENTSHIFWEFSEIESIQSSGVFLFWGDTHWARGFPYLETKISGYRARVLRILYQKYDPKNDPTTKYHRVFSWFDDVIVNWESGLVNSWSCEKSGKLTQMMTDSSMIEYFHTLWITLANVANNHSHDCGKKSFESSVSVFLSGGIMPFGYDQITFRTIRGNHFAFIGINMIEEKVNIQDSEKMIRALTESGNIVIVNIHFGIEYNPKYTKKQSQITHQLVDAWARLIVGHHSHVVGEYELYKGVPIYYSLGNFIFDQSFPETYHGILLECSINSKHTECQTIDILHDPHTYELSFSPRE